MGDAPSLRQTLQIDEAAGIAALLDVMKQMTVRSDSYFQ
jgi:hypothetical protein